MDSQNQLIVGVIAGRAKTPEIAEAPFLQTDEGLVCRGYINELAGPVSKVQAFLDDGATSIPIELRESTGRNETRIWKGRLSPKTHGVAASIVVSEIDHRKRARHSKLKKTEHYSVGFSGEITATKKVSARALSLFDFDFGGAA